MKVLDHIDDIAALFIVVVGVTAICLGRDSYLVGVVGTAMGYLFRAGVSRVKKGG